MLRHFSLSTLPQTPWKNGGGVTREILCWPPDADLSTFSFRASVATIAANGPFSRFEGIDRIIMLLEGDGVVLTSPEMQQRLEERHVPLSFRGEEAITCTLLGGPSADFNVMTRRSHARARLDLLTAATALARAEAGLFLVLAATWQINAHTCAPGDGLWWVAPHDEAHGVASLHDAPDFDVVPLESGHAMLAHVSWSRQCKERATGR